MLAPESQKKPFSGEAMTIIQKVGSEKKRRGNLLEMGKTVSNISGA